jgi:hypothetical protein
MMEFSTPWEGELNLAFSNLCMEVWSTDSFSLKAQLEDRADSISAVLVASVSLYK